MQPKHFTQDLDCEDKLYQKPSDRLVLEELRLGGVENLRN